MRRYRRNGTPIGNSRVYVVVAGDNPKVWEVTGCNNWEEVPGAIALEAMSGCFGNEFDLRHATAVMPGAELMGNGMEGCRLYRANLDGACLRGSYLAYAAINEAKMRDADFEDANLFRASMRDSSLAGSNLKKAYMVEADLTGADLTGADLTGAAVFRFKMEGANLEGCVRSPQDAAIPGWRLVNGKLRKA